jgi:uncharacterized caspase-like protein
LFARLLTRKKEFWYDLICYYAGHAIQVKGHNYLIPVDAILKEEQDVDIECLDANRILGIMEVAGCTSNIVIMDACNDNTFTQSWSGRIKGQEEGLAFMNAPSGFILAYSTSPGRTIPWSNGKIGLYTEAFVQQINVPGLSSENFFKNIRRTVENKTKQMQTPCESTSLKGNFFFKNK